MSAQIVAWGFGIALLVVVVFGAASSSRRGGGGRLGNALQPLSGIDAGPLLQVQSIYEPGKKHLIEQRQDERREDADEGDPS